MEKTFVEIQIENLNHSELKQLLDEKELAFNYLKENKINKEMQRILNYEIKKVKKRLNEVGGF